MMIAIDTNILFPLVVRDHPQHGKACAFAESLQAGSDVAGGEMVLLGPDNLLCNPAVMTCPLGASSAVDVCVAFPQHPVHVGTYAGMDQTDRGIPLRTPGGQKTCSSPMGPVLPAWLSVG
ncbi:MAG: hypothetical protein RLZZ253_760 [Verrucomicrobiota bacterium]|jgi:hypothetical protein